MPTPPDLLQAIGRLFITSSRCEWYIGEIITQSGLGDGHEMTWKVASDKMKTQASVVSQVVGRDVSEAIIESTRCSEILRAFRNKMTHWFLGDYRNNEGWIELKEKDLVNAPGTRMTSTEINDHSSIGDAALGGYKHIVMGLYHAKGLM